jgi:endonuclease YncB( thermonuclease family)
MTRRQTSLTQSLLGCVIFAILASGCSWNSTNANVQRAAPSTEPDGCPSTSQSDRSRAKITGTVIGVSDGDTVSVKDQNSARHTIRFFAIDAPENGQDFGKASKTNLTSLISNEPVCVVIIEKDQHGREVGIVFSSGEDINLAQISAGMAWHYKAHQNQQSGNDRWTYERAETQARSERRGLWKQPDAIPPWEYRKTNPRRRNRYRP